MNTPELPHPPLTSTQHEVLSYAIQHTGGKVQWFPDHVKGGACRRVLQGLASRSLVATQDDKWQVTHTAYVALGIEPLTPPLADDPEIEAAITAAEAEWHQQEHPTDTDTNKPRTRANTKQALVIQMLQRPEGASVAELMAATGWLNHTVRGTLSGVLSKRLGLNIVSAKNVEGVRAYRIV